MGTSLARFQKFTVFSALLVLCLISSPSISLTLAQFNQIMATNYTNLNFNYNTAHAREVQNWHAKSINTLSHFEEELVSAVDALPKSATNALFGHLWERLLGRNFALATVFVVYQVGGKNGAHKIAQIHIPLLFVSGRKETSQKYLEKLTPKFQSLKHLVDEAKGSSPYAYSNNDSVEAFGHYLFSYYAPYKTLYYAEYVAPDAEAIDEHTIYHHKTNFFNVVKTAHKYNFILPQATRKKLVPREAIEAFSELSQRFFHSEQAALYYFLQHWPRLKTQLKLPANAVIKLISFNVHTIRDMCEVCSRTYYINSGAQLFKEKYPQEAADFIIEVSGRDPHVHNFRYRVNATINHPLQITNTTSTTGENLYVFYNGLEAT